MEDEKNWRFPNNSYGPENGLDTGDIETFKKDPDAALAREICQNSIDASFGELPVRVEFKVFEIEREKIPGINNLTNEIEKCYDYKKDSEKEEKPLKVMTEKINENKIKCLRISDFNTSGLLGVSTNSHSKPFYNLTKGLGVSDKQGTSGGSKGIGKFATFVVSTTNTVFYSTKTKENEIGYIGISKLRSIPIDDNDPDLMTMGTGYYGISEKNLPILEELLLDSNFRRGENEYGTDIYIIGFNDEKNWQADIVSKILDSFMVAILNKKFEVVVDDIYLTNETIKDILYTSDLLTKRKKVEIRGIRAQYDLLTDEENIESKVLTVGENSKVTVYIKRYKSNEEQIATKQCVMVRYPYMKIRHKTGYSILPYSALCVIHDNELNKKLREIENPQHTDWEINRLNERPEDKKYTRLLKKELEVKIREYIEETLRQTTGDRTDVEGAGDFLPSFENDGEGHINEIEKSDKVTVLPPKKVNVYKPPTEKINEADFTSEYDETSDDESEGDSPSEGNSGGGEGGNNGNPPNLLNKETSGKKSPLGGMRYRNIVVDKKQGKYDIIFTSQYDEKNCELELKMLGETRDKYPIEIISAKINDVECEIQDGKIVNFNIVNGKKYKISYVASKRELFASEVILNAYR